MSETTVMGWDYPQSTDQIAQGAVNIETTNKQIEGNLFLAPNAFTASTPWTSYPNGTTLFRVGGDATWPFSTGQVLTFKTPGTAFIYQVFQRYSSGGGLVVMYFRQGWTNSGTATWSGWFTMGGTGAPTASASGDVTLTPPSGGGDVSVVVTLPSSRFANQDTAGKLRIFTEANTTSPTVATSASWTSTGTITSFQIFLNRGTATATGIHWYAIQGAA